MHDCPCCRQPVYTDDPGDNCEPCDAGMCDPSDAWHCYTGHCDGSGCTYPGECEGKPRPAERTGL